ncbi:pyridoxamine 5'-phosphate oxidase family protein [Cribrihabitans sp. XS_ASV171]
MEDLKYIESEEELRTVYDDPTDGAIRKQLARLDSHARNFIARAPFLVIASQDASGRTDATPKGDRPGFVEVLDDRTIAIPDRPGNNRLDTFRNIISNPRAGILFIIPGMNETLRVNGRAHLTVNSGLCARLGMNGRPAKSVMLVEVEEVFMHCAKAFIRSSLWKPTEWPDRSEMPTLGEILRDQVATSRSADAIDDALTENYRTELW